MLAQTVLQCLGHDLMEPSQPFVEIVGWKTVADAHVTRDSEVVAHIESEREFEIDLDDGRSVVARPGGGDADGNQILMVKMVGPLRLTHGTLPLCSAKGNT